MQLKDFDSLEQAQAHMANKARLISPDMMISFLTYFKLIAKVTSAASNEGMGLNRALSFGSEFNVINGHPSSVRSLMDKLVEDGILTEEFCAHCVNYANAPYKPFKGATQAKFNSAKGLYKSISINYQGGKDIVITLNTDLAEKVAATVWRTESGFDAENAGRNVHIQTAKKYRIDMSGKKSGNYEVRMPLLDADFAVELI